MTDRLKGLVARVRPGHRSPIIPIVLGDEATALDAARQFESTDPLAAAALAFARAVKDRSGHVPDAAVDAARAAGIDDARMVDIAALVAINLFTNYVNNLAKPQD
jgi:alkylhydroperoxidase family enzyme